jgi:hypothetical protein
MPRPQIEAEPYFEFSIPLPRDHVFTARARPATIRRTAVRLLPWALYAAIPPGKLSRFAFMAASRFSPIARQQ